MEATNNGIAALDGERPVLLPPGLYDVGFNRYWTWRIFGRGPKLTLEFRILTMGEHFEKKILAHYNVKKLIDRPSVNGRFKVGFSSDFLREFSTLFGAPTRFDRIPMSNFEKHIFVAKVRTVSKGSGQKAIPEGMYYSTIDELVRIKQ